MLCSMTLFHGKRERGVGEYLALKVAVRVYFSIKISLNEIFGLIF